MSPCCVRSCRSVLWPPKGRRTVPWLGAVCRGISRRPDWSSDGHDGSNRQDEAASKRLNIRVCIISTSEGTAPSRLRDGSCSGQELRRAGSGPGAAPDRNCAELAPGRELLRTGTAPSWLRAGSCSGQELRRAGSGPGAAPDRNCAELAPDRELLRTGSAAAETRR